MWGPCACPFEPRRSGSQDQLLEVIHTMPTYEYLCKSCNHRFEQWQKMTDDPLEICPECGGHIRRVLYPAGIVFKGSGFYKTDHPSGNGANGHHDHEHEHEHDGSKKEESAAPTESNSSTNSSGESKAAPSTPASSTGSTSAAAKTDKVTTASK
jgi:putative FmdB family regulatory protein